MDTGNRARVILRGDGSVHIAFWDRRTIYATAETLSRLMDEDVMAFIDSGYQSFRDSTLEANRKLAQLDDIPGLTLAKVTKNREFVCIFQELYRYFFAGLKNDKELTKPINMKAYLETAKEISDQKSFLLKYYFEMHIASAAFKKSLTIKKNVRIDEETQVHIIREMLNSIWDDDLPAPTALPDISTRLEQTKANEEKVAFLGQDDPKVGMVGIVEYADIIGACAVTVRKYIKDGRIKSAQKDENGFWRIDKNDRPTDWDLRAKRKRKHVVDGKNYKRKKTGSAADVAEHIRALKMFAEPVPDFIHSFEELDYYTRREYHQICLDAYGNATTTPGPGMKHYLIVDVNLEYISRRHGISNREAIQRGLAPVVPDPTGGDFLEPEWHLHHVGQNSKSPIAIVNKEEHLSAEYSSVFHQGAPDRDLHGPSWNAEKASFWRTYAELYDRYGYKKIPYLNPRTKKYK